MIINESNREDIATCPSGETDKGVRRPHAPRAPSPIREREFVTTILQEPFKQGPEYVSTLEGLNYIEDMRAENLGPDSEEGENMDNILEDSQEKEETQAAITLKEPHGQEARRVEDPDRRGRPGGEIKELHAPQPPPPEAQKSDRSRLKDIGHKG